MCVIFFPVFLSNLACLFLFFRQFDVFCLVLLYILLLCKYFNYTYIFLHSVENPKIYSQNCVNYDILICSKKFRENSMHCNLVQIALNHEKYCKFLPFLRCGLSFAENPVINNSKKRTEFFRENIHN